MHPLRCLLCLAAAPAVHAVSGDESNLVQHLVIPQEQLALHRDAGENWPLPPSWSTGPYSDCMSTCGQEIKERSVECVSFVDGRTLEHDMCFPTTKPSTHAACSCDLDLCNKTSIDCGKIDARKSPLDPHSFVSLGCFQLHADDGFNISQPCEADHFDYACVNWTGAGLCRSGFPFYRNCNARTPAACSAFCTSKGLDLSAVVEGKVCRCGASGLNQQVWHEHKPLSQLLFKIDQLTPEPELKKCSLMVNRYSGYYQSRGIPPVLLKITLDDEAYRDGLITSQKIAPDEEEGVPEAVSNLREVAELGPPSVPSWKRPCWPDNCGPGRGPWPARSKNRPNGITTDFEEYVIIKYAFRNEVDATRKEAFKRATEAWYTTTCVILKEVALDANAQLFIEVGVNNVETCEVDGVGKGHLFFNVGSCSDLTHVGNIIHELGHALGMNNKQERPDAQAEYFGKGPYLTPFGGFVDAKSYTGSLEDGARDPHIGYAEYDFDSIMHAPPDHFDTFPASEKARVGQRVAPSAGDVAQILDMYQCRTTQPTSRLDLRGSEVGCPSLEGVYSLLMTSTEVDHRFYKAVSGDMWMHWDQVCGWVVDSLAPNPHLTEAVDEDKDCSQHVAVHSEDAPKGSPPMGTGSWKAKCSGSGTIELTISIATTTTTSTITTTTTTTTTTITTTTITTTTITTKKPTTKRTTKRTTTSRPTTRATTTTTATTPDWLGGLSSALPPAVFLALLLIATCHH